MKALVHEAKAGTEGLSFRNMEKPVPKAGEVRVKLKAMGMNHRDLFILDRHKPVDPPLILGSDGAGVIDEVGEGVVGVAVGDEVVINPSLNWKENSDCPPPGFEIVGFPDHGTFAEYVAVPIDNVEIKPNHLNWEEAGVLSLAALTAYRALFTQGKAKDGMNILIPGIGGGVATFLLQFAKAAGANVFVTSRSAAKCQQALQLGASQALNSEEDWTQQLNGQKMDLVIESVGAATFNQSLKQLRPGGTIVTFGSSTGDSITLNLRDFFYGQFTLKGSTMGSKEEYKNMLRFISKHQIKPVMDKTFGLAQYEQAFERLEKAEQLGKICLIPE